MNETEKQLGYKIEDLISPELKKERDLAIEKDGNSDNWDKENYAGLAAAAGLRAN